MENYTQELDGGAIEPSPDAMLDATDRAILNLIQSSFPIESRPSWEEVCAAFEAITQKTGIEILNLPATRPYKIKVDFNME